VIKETTPAIINGTFSPYLNVTADIAGPKTKPKPNAAPIIPKPFALSLSDVVSEMTADATGIFPAVIPSKARAKKRKNALGANAAIKKETAVPKIDEIRRGRLPNLSERRPMIGVEINWHIEKIAKSNPFSKSVNPYFSEYEYKIGIIIPYPSELITAIRAMINKLRLFLNIGN